MSLKYPIPSTPQVISPSPPVSEHAGKDEYFAPKTRSKTASERTPARSSTDGNDANVSRARGRDRTSQQQRSATETSTSMNGSTTMTEPTKAANGTPNGTTATSNGFLSPASAYPQGRGTSYWRNLSRSPSPLGLIPIHREWRDFIHKHEVPRKVLHVSIGFVTLWLYSRGVATSQIHPVLLSLLVPIFTTDVIRFQWPAFNTFYIRVLGPFMRESEAHDRFNGVISYLAGVWLTMLACPKDVAVMSVLLLSWSDTAASTVGRAFGKYTPRIRKGKSLAGSLAAFGTGVVAAVLFWKVVAEATAPELQDGFAFRGALTLPAPAQEFLGLTVAQATITGNLALGVLALSSGFIASVSEAVDIFGLDDNLTIPILSGFGLAAFLWAFVS